MSENQARDDYNTLVDIARRYFKPEEVEAAVYVMQAESAYDEETWRKVSEATAEIARKYPRAGTGLAEG